MIQLFMQEVLASIILSRYKYIVILLLIGIGVGGLVLVSRTRSNSNIEVLSESISETPQISTASAMLAAEISGSVQNPGVYKFSTGARIDDLFQASGGLADDADLLWVEKYINKAAKIIDGQKIFIPAKGSEQPLVSQPQNNQSEVLSATKQGEGVESPAVVQAPTTIAVTGLININNASKSKLEELWGIGPVTAQKIIDQRPYSDISELIKRKIVKSNVYERIKDQISVY